MSIGTSVQNVDTGAIRDEYWAKGYVVLRGLFDPKRVMAWRDEVERLLRMPGIADDLNLRSEFRRDVDGSWVLDRLDPFLDLSPVLSKGVLDPHLMQKLSDVLGGPTRIMKCKLIRKDPGTAGYAVHQDHLYWRWLDIPADRLCSVAIPLYRTDELSGGIELFPGYHQSLLPSEDGDPDKDMSISQIDVSRGEIPVLEPGDVLIFHGLAPHRSGANKSDLPRVLMLPSYAVTTDENLYARYQEREIRRRCREFVGFETLENGTSNVFRPGSPSEAGPE